MKSAKKIIALVLTLLLALPLGTLVCAAQAGGTPYDPGVARLDRLFGRLHDGIFALVQGLLRLLYRQFRIPTLTQYLAAPHDHLYPGTDGVVTGNGWRAGYASASIIPVKWRRNAQGKPDPNGWCLDRPHTTGGYQYILTKIYTEQSMNCLLLSNGADKNGNGVPDLMIEISVDGVGVTAATTKKIRAAVEGALLPLGVAREDILACNVSATHCHVALDTQGMNVFSMFSNSVRRGRSLNAEMEDTLVSRAAQCAKEAFASMEDGTLSYFETAPVNDGAEDKLKSGVRTQNYFACLLFTGSSGQKTILANLAAHPTKSYNGGALFADYPHLMQMAMRDAGYNFLFVQSAQANINGPGLSVPDDSPRAAEADAWVSQHALSREDWLKRYGAAYTKLHYLDHREFNETMAEEQMRNAYLLAHHILDAEDAAVPVTPSLEVRTAQTLVRLEYGVMAMGCVSGLLGEETVLVPDAESGYGIMLETDYLAIGDRLVILTAPCELSPSLVYGTDPDYTGDAPWNGETSWTGETWTVDTLEQMVRFAANDPDKTVLVFGLTNGGMGYVYPDVCATQSILAPRLFYKMNVKAMANSMLLTMGAKSGSQIVEGYRRVIENK